MDLLSMLKMANIFSPQLSQPDQNGMIPPSDPNAQSPMSQMPQGNVPPLGPTQAPQGQGLDLQSAIQGMLQPRDDQFQNYANMIQSMPKPQQYEPSKFRKVMAGIAGLGAGGPATYYDGAALGYKSNIPEGLAIQRSIEDDPYHKALETWQNQLKPQGDIAQMESNRNTNLRQIGLGEMSRQNTADRNAETAKRDENTRQYQQGRLSMQQQRIDFNAYKQANPNDVIKEDSDGNMIGINQQTGISRIITNNETGEPVKSAIFTDAEKFNQQQENKLKQISATGEQTRQTNTLKSTQSLTNAKELEGVRNLDRLGLAETNIAGRQQLQSAKPAATAAAKPMLPTQQKQDTINKAVKAVSLDPSLKPYVKFDKSSSGAVTGVSIPPAGDSWFSKIQGYKESERMRAYNTIFGQSPVPGVSQQIPQQRKLIPGTNKYAVSTDGGKTWKAE